MPTLEVWKVPHPNPPRTACPLCGGRGPSVTFCATHTGKCTEKPGSEGRLQLGLRVVPGVRRGEVGPWAVASPAFQVLGRAALSAPHASQGAPGCSGSCEDEPRLPRRPACTRWSTERGTPRALSTAKPSSFWLSVLSTPLWPRSLLATPFFRNVDCFVFLRRLFALGGPPVLSALSEADLMASAGAHVLSA